jgi:hypothetical protein
MKVATISAATFISARFAPQMPQCKRFALPKL